MQNKFFPEIKKNFGFGCMRLPMAGDEVDTVEFSKMVDAFINAGFNYFDTAHGYLGGKSETAIKECLTSRYPRDKYLLVNKLSGSFFKSEEEIRPLIDLQLEACGVEYFDFLLMHAQEATLYERYKKCRAYETAFDLKREGKVRHVGLSFHDRAEVLDKILSEYPEIEIVQIQFNYADFEDASVQSKLCLEVCQKHGKPVVVMEPVKGGSLVNLPDSAKAILDELHGGSYASYAIRFAASFDNIIMVLSGMGNMDMMNDNISYMKDFKPLDEKEFEAINKVLETVKEQGAIQCTACRYCVDGCPMSIKIPDLFNCYNGKKVWNSWNYGSYYRTLTKEGGAPSTCIECGACEESCPQHLPIRELLKEVANEFEKKE